MAPVFDDFPQTHVQALDGVGGVDDLAHRRRIGEEGDDLLPIAPPGLADGRIFAVPFLLELIQPLGRRAGAFRPVDGFEMCRIFGWCKS